MIVFGMTDRGCVRPVNEDSFRVFQDESTDTAVIVLCDGMGGRAAGEIASALAAESFLDYVREGLQSEAYPEMAQLVKEGCAVANLSVFDRAHREKELTGMGCTLVAAVVSGDSAVVLNVGDSRCYLLSGAGFQRVSHDHSLVQELVYHGEITEEEARSHPRRNIITRAVGTNRLLQSDLFFPALQEGDTLLLCSDGLSELVSDSELSELMLAHSEVGELCEKLVTLVLERGAPDNVTVAVLRR